MQEIDGVSCPEIDGIAGQEAPSNYRLAAWVNINE